jgi:hypothetical protein
VARGVGHPDVMPQITPRDERVAVVGAGRPGSPSLASSRRRATRSRSSTACRTAAARCSSASRRSASRARRSRWTSASSSGSASGSSTTRRSASTSRSSELQRDFDAVAITAGAMDAVALDIPAATSTASTTASTS